MFNCPKCGKPTNKLKADYNLQERVCPQCYTGDTNVQYGKGLHDSIVDDGKTRVSKGKSWEIGQRMLSRDDKMTVINRSTGKETQY